MEETLDIDDDVLAAVMDLAAEQNVSPGKVLCDLVRKSLSAGVKETEVQAAPQRIAFPLLAAEASVSKRSTD